MGDSHGQERIHHGTAHRTFGPRLQQWQTGHAPKSVTVNLNEGMLVITLHDALTPAERRCLKLPRGPPKCGPLRAEIERITGVAVREAAVEVETTTGAIVQVLSTGTIVQVFQLAGGLSAKTWNGSGDEPAE